MHMSQESLEAIQRSNMRFQLDKVKIKKKEEQRGLHGHGPKSKKELKYDHYAYIKELEINNRLLRIEKQE